MRLPYARVRDMVVTIGDRAAEVPTEGFVLSFGRDRDGLIAALGARRLTRYRDAVPVVRDRINARVTEFDRRTARVRDAGIDIEDDADFERSRLVGARDRELRALDVIEVLLADGVDIHEVREVRLAPDGTVAEVVWRGG